MSGLALGLGLAVIASVALNIAYLLQHAGSAGAPDITPLRPLATMRGLLTSPLWVLGLAVGITGWALHVAALSRAPVSLVQAFVAGGLVLAVPFATGFLGHRLARTERAGVCLMALALALLSLGLRPEHGHPLPGTDALGGYLAAACACATALAALPAGDRRAQALGVAGGMLYGAADLAIQALTSLASSGGAAAVLRSPWLAVAALTTLAAFFAFQRSLQTGRPLPVIALMTAATNVVSILGGLAVFGDPLGGPALATAHLAGFALVGLAAWWLAPTQAALATGEVERARTSRARPHPRTS
ncbi:MAG: hypothetical protein QOK04_1932 [Solirubrobacteraceae bacterium]|nr:hypothetical protein [Solirubrobacteraceae bacterium]